MLRYLNAYILFPLLNSLAKRDVLRKYRELRAYERLSREEQKKIQAHCLCEFLLFCQAEVPYYKTIFKQYNFDPHKIIQDTRYLIDLPVLTKQLVRDNTEDLKLSSAVHPRKTGGSTGQSVMLYYDNEGLDWTAAVNLMAYSMAHNYPYRKDCHISSELGVGPVTRKGKFMDWLKLFSQNRSRLMIGSFSDESLRNNIADLGKLKPFLLQGHPSSAYAIAEYIASDNRLSGKYCCVFEPSGEMLTEKMVKSIEKNLGAKVVNRYGNAEFGVIAHSRFSDSWNKLKIFERAFLVEECKKSNLIITGFTNRGMPLIRYDTGDVATVQYESDGAYIYDIQGRVHDTVVIDGEPYATHFIMDYLDHKITRVREFQILLQVGKHPLLNIVPEDSNDMERIRQLLLDRWPSGLDIDFISFDQLKKVGWRKKFRHVIDMREQ